MPNASPELIAVVKRWNEAIRLKDKPSLNNLLSDAAYLRYVGSAKSEIWSGALLKQGIGAHFDEVPEFNYIGGALEAFEEGNTGWAFWHGQIHFESTDVISDYRISFVFVLEQGQWKIVHIHISNPTSNFDKLGVEHEALDALISAASEGTLGLGREGIATVMFTDVVDSSAMANLIGDRAWISRIDAHLETIAQIVHKAGGTMVKSLGDGTMSTFTSTRAALGGAQKIQRRCLQETTEPLMRVRIGVHTGDVIENKGDFFGTVVNKAARINAIAAPDGICISDATKLMLGRAEGFEIVEPRVVKLKGLDGDHIVYRLNY